MPNAIVINEGVEMRTSKSGKARYTITVKSEALIFATDPKPIMKQLAGAVALHYRNAVKSISAEASARTLAYRKEAAKAFREGKSWAMKAYSGGRMGPMGPKPSTTQFNDSGRFAESITANASSDGKWRVNVAANRLNQDATTVRRIWDRLVELVPEFAKPELLMNNEVIRGQLKRAINGTMTKLPASSKPAEPSRIAQALELGEALAKTLENVAGLFGG